MTKINEIDEIGDFIAIVLSIDNEPEMRAFVEEYLRFLQEKNPDGPIEQTMRLDIGYCFGEGMTQERIDQWYKVCGAYHWIFGIKAPKTSLEAARQGEEWAKENVTAGKRVK